MGLKMPFNFVRAAEALATNGATVRLFPRMDSHVYLQVSHLCEALAANLTAEWFFSCVTTLVLLQSAGGAAAFPAYSTAIRFFPSVHLNMHMQVADVTKRFATNLATERGHVAL